MALGLLFNVGCGVRCVFCAFVPYLIYLFFQGVCLLAMVINMVREGIFSKFGFVMLRFNSYFKVHSDLKVDQACFRKIMVCSM